MNPLRYVYSTPGGAIRACLIFLSLAAILAAATPIHATTGVTIIYVVPGGTGSGASWADGKNLAAALRDAPSGSQLWVKAGVYTPDPTGLTDPRSATFALKSGVAVYGGFAGTETLLSQRNWQANISILSGDLNGDDEADSPNNGDNSYHVVTGNGTNSSAILDGFTISGGNANGSSPDNDGGGMGNVSGSPTLTNVTFISNYSGGGGGMVNQGGSPTLTNVTFSGNQATSGGGMFINGGSPTLTNVTFSGNNAELGGGMYNQSSGPTLTNVTFSGNSVLGNTAYGGGMYNSGGNPTLTNVTFSGNYAPSGGGMYNSYDGSPTIRNSILWGDTGSEIVNDGGGTASVTYSIVQQASGVYPGTGNRNQDPLFVTPVTLPPPANTSGNLRLQANSPAIDAGNNNVTDPSLPATDLDGNPRILGSAVDMGAYEFLCPPGTPARLYVNASVSGGTGKGEIWTNASPTLAFALARALACPTPIVTEIWVAQGTYKPTSGTDPSATFQLRTGLAIYGGFTSGQTSLSLRNANPATNNTVLSGDLNGDDGPNFANNGDNSYHVVTAISVDDSAILDGFTVRGGNAIADSPINSGGGMYNTGSPTLTNIAFSGNSAYYYGGGMDNDGGSPTLTNVTFSRNRGDLGGGMGNSGGSPTLTNVTFSGNYAQEYGGGMYNASGNNVTLTNVTFSGNSVGFLGGGIANLGNAAIHNTILWGDSSPEIYSPGSATVTYSIVQRATVFPGTGNLNVDPQFVDAANGNLRLGLTSPAINAGNNSDIPSGVTTDLDGAPRIVYGVVDMGAYEAQVAVTKFSVSAPSSATQGSAFSVTVTAQDPNGVTVSAYRGTVHFTSSDGAAVLPADYAFTAADAGAHTFTLGVTLNTLGSQSVTATDTSNSNVTGSASVNVVRPTTRVTSIMRVGSTPTNASSVSWTVTFANAVSGLTASNFALAVTGLGGTPTIGTVTPTGSAPTTTWTVTASTGTGDGSLGLNLTNDTGLSSQVTNTPFVGPVYIIDRTAPTITITSPADGAVYLQGAPLTASFTCSDPGGSGVASCVGTVPNGSPLSTATVGSFSFTVTATDNVGNTTSQTVHYTVGYSVGTVSPTVGPPGVNALYPLSIGTTATPVKWTLKNAAGQAITAAGTVKAVSYKPTSCSNFTTDPTGATAASITSSNPKYDTLQKLWVYNWVLPGRGCYTLFVTLNTGQVVPLFYHIY
ncbi:MAG: choice-of-anchor Q domain-containing protein [Anaerolineae bacterium]